MAKVIKKRSDTSVMLVRKANELVEARYKFDIWETRVFAKMLTMIKPDDKDFQLYHIHVGDLLKDFNLKDGGDNYNAVKQATKKMLSRVIEIQKETPEGLMWYAMPLIIGAKGFVEPKGDNFISVQFHQELKPYLLELKERYLQYDIRNLWGLSSVYSVRMYELLKQYERIGKRFFPLDDLKLKLAIQPNEYEKYNHFKDKVLLKAQGDLANCTDITFDIEEHKQGRKVSGLMLYIHANPNKRIKKELPAPSVLAKKEEKDNVFDNNIFEKLYKQVKIWGITEPTLRKLIADKGIDQVKTGLTVTLENLKDSKVKTNIAGFFIKSVNEGWKSISQIKQNEAEDFQAKRSEQKVRNIEKLEQLTIILKETQETKQTELNEIIKKLTQADAFLAGEAVNKIVSTQSIKKALEEYSGLNLDSLDMNDWRNNKLLRDAVIKQIELMYPSNFKEIHKIFDSQIRQLKNRIEELQMAVKK